MQDSVQNGDTYLLCSDGLTDLVTNDEILQLLLLYKDDLKTGCKELISLANEKGGKDNISVILVSLQEAYSDNAGVEE